MSRITVGNEKKSGCIGLSAVAILIAAWLCWEGWQWTVNYVWVDAGESLMLRFKGNLIFTYGQTFASQRFAEGKECGVKKEMLGPGRHFYCPIWWERTIVKNVVVKSGELAQLTSRLGEDLPAGEFLVEGDPETVTHKGCLRRLLAPGYHRINPYGFDVKIIKTEKVEVKDGPTYETGWVMIEPGYVGVATHQTDDPLAKRKAGMQMDTLPPGLYSINPRAVRINVISIGYNNTEVSTEKLMKNGAVAYDDSGEEIPVPDTGIYFPSSDGYTVHADFSAIWGVMPEQAPDAIRRFGNLKAIEQKVIQPQVQSICRNNGTGMTTVQLLVGETRTQFQEKVDEDFTVVLKEKNLSLLYGLVRHIYIPKETREPIQKGYVAEELKLTREVETETANMEGTLRQAEQTVLMETAKIIENTKKLEATTAQEGEKKAKETEAETEAKVAEIDLQTAQLDAKRVTMLGEAEAGAKKLSQEAQANLFELAVKAFNSPAAYTNWQFAQSLPDTVDLKMIYAGVGTMWTDLKNVTPVVNIQPPTVPVKTDK